MYYFITILLLLLFTVYSFKRVNQKRLQDSPLKRRGILNIAEQITLVRLNTILPEHTILAHVAFDALLTTKYAHTRRKYQGLIADFVILDHQYQVLAIIEIVDESYVNRLHQKHYQDCLLELAGYRVLRYSSIPTEQQLRADLVADGADDVTISTKNQSTAIMAQSERLLKYQLAAARTL